MSKILLNLRHVPDDEADDIRALLDAHAIDWYQTDAGRWGISFAGIWLRDESQSAQVEQLMADYQQQRQQQAKQSRQADQLAGTSATLMAAFRNNPAGWLLAAAGIVLVLGLTALPILLLAR